MSENVHNDDFGELERILYSDMLRVSLAEFVKAAWHVLEPSTELIWNWHIDAICQHLEAVTDKKLQHLLINIPPGHMKSLLVSVFWPAWVWLSEPSWRVLYGSYAQELSVRDSVRCRDLILSQWYQETFKPKWKIKSDQNVKSWFENTAKGMRMALSVGGKGTGFRGDCIVFDDPHNVKELSEGDLKQAKFWWHKRMSSRLNDMRSGSKVGIAQRLDEDDLSGDIIARGDYVHLCLPTEFDISNKCVTEIEGNRWEDPRKKDGDLLFPQMFPANVVKQIKTDLGSYDFAGQHQQRPAPKEGAVIKIQWCGNRYSELPSGSGEWFQSWDPKAGSKDPSSSRAVGQVWFCPASQRGRIYLVHQVSGLWEIDETMAEIEQLSKTYSKTTKKLVENKADGRPIITMLKNKVPGLHPVEPKGDKLARLRAVLPIWEAGNVWLPDSNIAPWIDDFIHEVTTFPSSKHDDQVDAMTQALSYYSKNYRNIKIKSDLLQAGSRVSPWQI